MTKSELEALGEETDNVMSSSKLRDLVKGYTGVDIMLDENTYKDIYTIVKEIGDEWENLNDIEQAALLEALAGKKQSNTLAAVLNNADRLEEIYETAENSAGSAQREQEKYTQSLQYSLDQLTAHGEEFWSTFINKDDVKDFIDLINTLISGLTKFVDIFGSIPTVAGIFGAYNSIKGGGIFRTITDEATGAAKGIGLFGKSMTDIKKTIASVKTNGLFKASLLSETDVACINKYNNAIAKGVPHQKAMKQATKGASAATKQLIANANGSKIALNNMTVGAKAATIGLNAVKTAANAIWWMAIISLITSAISWIQDFGNSGEKAKEAAAELTEELNTQKTTIENNTSTIKGLESEFKRLSKGVDDYGSNISLSTDEYAKYQQIVQQIVGISPSLISGYDKEGNAIANKNGLIEQSIALLKEENRQRVASATSKSSVATIAEGKIQEIKDFMKDNPLPYGNAKYDFLQTFATAADNYAVRGKEKNLSYYDLFKTFGFSGYDWNEYSSMGDHLKGSNFAQDFFDQLAEDIRNGGEKIKQVFSNSEIYNLTAFLQMYDQNMSAYNRQMAQFEKTLNPTLQMVPQSLTVYDELTDRQKAFISEYINTFRITADTTTNDVEEMRQNILNFTEAVGNASSDTKKIIDDLFSLDKTKMSAEQWENKVNDLISQIVNSFNFNSEEDKNEFIKQLKIRIGVEFDTDGQTSIDVMIRGVKEKLKDEFDHEVNRLNLYDLQTAYNIISELPENTLLTWDQLKEKIDEVTKNSDEMTVSLSELEEVSNKIKSLGDAYKELSDEGYITIGTLNDIKEASGLSSKEWEEYQNRLMTVKIGSAEYNQLMTDLTYKILDNTFAGRDFNDVTKEEIELLLKENGVLNYGAVTLDYYKRKKAESNAESLLAKISEEGFADSIKNVATECGLTTNAIADMILKMINLNAQKLDFYQQIEQIRKLRKAMDLSSDVDTAVLGITSHQGTVGIGYMYNGKWYDDYNEAYKVALNDDTSKNFESNVPQRITPDYSGAASGSGSDQNEVLDNYLKDAERRYKIHQDETKYIQELEYACKNLTKSEKERLDVTDKINEAYKDLADNQIKDLEHQIDLAKELHGDDVDVTDYYDQIQNVASKEANRLRAKGYDDNSDEIQDLQKTWWDAQNKKLDFYTKQHENTIRDIEHTRDMALEQNPYRDTTSYYKQMQAEYHKQAEYLRALDPEKYKEDIQKLQEAWWEAQRSIADWSYSNSERWINERNTYNDWELYGDSEVEAWERVLERFKTEFPNELEKIRDIKQKIFEARKEAMEKSISDIEDYISARNHFNDWDVYGDTELEAIQRQIRAVGNAYDQSLMSTEDYIERLEEYSQRIYSLAQDEVNKHLSNIDKYIEARNHYNDWDDYGDTEIEAIRRQCEVLDEAYERNLISLEEYTEKSEEYAQKLYSVAKNNIIETISELIEDYEEMKQDETDALNFESKQYGATKTLLQSYYDVTNAITEAQHEINKELRASQSMYEYLNEETRELLFNQEDYNILSEELLDIQTAANELQKQYEEDILGATKETIDEITSQYQMQYETMMKKYEIAKAELDVAKKRQKLDNVLAERNVRMFINGQWQWVANTQNVIDAQKELADAEIEREQKETSLKQIDSINKLTEAQDDITTQINYIETDLEQIRDKWAKMQEMLDGESDEVAEVLREISQVSSPELQRVIEATGGSLDSFSTSLSESIVAMSTVVKTELSTGIGDIVTELENYADAIKKLVKKIDGLETDEDDEDDKVSVKDVIAQMQANAEKWHDASDEEREALHKENLELGASIGAKYDESTGKWTYPEVKSSSKGSSSSSGKGSSSSSSSSGSSSSNKVNTKDQYISDSTGHVQTNPNWDGKDKGGIGSFYEHADGTRYTPGGLTLMGEEGFEAFITNNGRLIPINQPTIGNIGAGGIVFNREQMANLRNLWDLSNLGSVSPFISSGTNNQSTVIDNSIHINGLTVGEQGNEDWINGLRRYVATHK